MAGVTQLGYLVFEVSDLAAWRDFGTQVLGMRLVDDRGDQGFGLQMDGHYRRFAIVPGSSDDLAAIGWEVADQAALDEVTARLEGAGYTVRAGSNADAARRHVTALVHFEDPAGHPGELHWGPKPAEEAFSSNVVPSGFVADEQGLGHVVVTSRSNAEHEKFYTEMLGFRLSDYIRCEFFGHEIDVTFMHCNARHHSLAFAKGDHKRVLHFMVEAGSMIEVGRCYDRFLFAGGQVHQTLGRHPNDQMFSFYGYTPSGFHFEFGYGGVQVDDATWQSTVHPIVSEWGHHPPHLLTKAYRKAKKAREEQAST